MKSLTTKQLLTILLCGTILLLPACSKKNVTAPVQFDYTETVGCLVTNDLYAIYFSAYLKPEGDLENIKGKDRNKLLRSYCKKIPKSGSLYFTADLVDEDVRETPISVRLVKQELIGEDERKVENFKDTGTIFEVPAKLYPRGMVEMHIELDKEGFYALYLSIGEENTITEENILRIPMHVGVDPDAVSPWHIALRILAVCLGLIIPVILGLIMFSPIIPAKQWVQEISRRAFFLNHKQGIETQK